MVVIFIIITVVVIGIIVVWKRRKNEHTKPEGVYYSTINETMLQRTPSNKPEPAVYSEMNDGQDSKEPEYMDISKSGQSTEQAGRIIMQDNPAYSVEHQVKMQDNPAYSVTTNM